MVDAVGTRETAGICRHPDVAVTIDCERTGNSTKSVVGFTGGFGETSKAFEDARLIQPDEFGAPACSINDQCHKLFSRRGHSKVAEVFAIFAECGKDLFGVERHCRRKYGCELLNTHGLRGFPQSLNGYSSACDADGNLLACHRRLRPQCRISETQCKVDAIVPAGGHFACIGQIGV